MNLDYFIASLPLLRLEEGDGMSCAEYGVACREQLAPQLAEAASALMEGQPHSHPFAQRWHERETILRNAVARRRAARRGGDTQADERQTVGSDLRIEQAVVAAFELRDPLQRERALDRLRWSILDELQGNQPLAAEVALAYAVRLRLLERWRALDEAQGKERLEAMLG